MTTEQIYTSEAPVDAGEVSSVREAPAVSMSLLAEASSDEAHSVVSSLASQIFANARRVSKPRKSYLNALAATLNDLLKAAMFDPPRPCFRSMRAGSFTGNDIGFRAFKMVKDDLQRFGWVTVLHGFADPRTLAKGAGFVTRIWPSIRLLEYLVSFGITASNRSKHFKIRKGARILAAPIILKGCKPKLKFGKSGDAPTLPIDPMDGRAAALAERVRALNDYFALQELDGAEHIGFTRIFQLGDTSGFRWNKGGRLHSWGGGYQSDSKELRPAITINGEATAELDIRASHLTILHALEGIEMPDVDPYIIPGIPRDIVKGWVTATLGYTHFHTRWPDRQKKRYKGNLQKDYPISHVKDQILERLPLLKDWPLSRLNWADLQFIEGEIIFRAVERLALEHDVPAYPIYDSIIVPASMIEVGNRVLNKVFKDMTGLKPSIKSKYIKEGGRGEEGHTGNTLLQTEITESVSVSI